MKFYLSMRNLILCLLFVAPALASSQTKMDADESDVAALLQKVELAHSQVHPDLRSGSLWEKRCDKGKGYNGSGPSEMCVTAWIGEHERSDLLLLKGCSYDPGGPPGRNACLLLAEFYLKQGRYIEGLAALKLPHTAQADDDRTSETEYILYHELGNLAKQKEVREHQCHDLADELACEILNKDFGAHVNLEDASNREAARDEQNKADEAQRQADAEQQQRDKAANRAELLNTITGAIAAVGSAAPRPSINAPVYQTPSLGSNQSSEVQRSDPQAQHSCRDMIACVKVTSSNYDAGHFLHVVVRNDCDTPIRATTSVYAQNRRCTVGQTDNLSPGQSEDLGAGTDRNWYQVQADDSVRSAYDGSGCKLVISNSCY